MKQWYVDELFKTKAMHHVVLSPEQWEEIDAGRQCRQRIMGFPLRDDQSYFEKPSQYFRRTPQENIDKYYAALTRQLSGTRHTPYLEFTSEMLAKCGPQGGCYSQDKLYAKVRTYYERACNQHHIHEDLISARDYLIARIKEHIARNGYPQLAPQSCLNTWAGSPSALQKGDFIAESLSASPWRHVYPTVPGQRRMRNGDRTIFQDSNLNVRYIERQMTAVRNWLRSEFPEYFDAWLNPETSQRTRIDETFKAPHTYVEWDYVGMDTGFSWDLVQALILPIYETLIPEGFYSFSACIEELFRQPVVTPTGLIFGLHNLFSGQVITNDFETIYTVLLVLAKMLKKHVEWRMFVLGDDMTLAIRSDNLDFGKKILAEAIDTSGQLDMLIHDDEKSRVVQNEMRFCRKVYYPAAPKDILGRIIGAYPVVLTLNNIFQPERPATTPGGAALATLQRLDNQYGTIDFSNVCNYVASLSTQRLQFDDNDILLYRTKAKDWWLRVYGESWEPYSSRSFKLLNR